MGKEASLLGFGSARVLTKVSVGSVRFLHKCKIFGFSSSSVLIFSVLSSVRFSSM